MAGDLVSVGGIPTVAGGLVLVGAMVIHIGADIMEAGADIILIMDTAIHIVTPLYLPDQSGHNLVLEWHLTIVHEQAMLQQQIQRETQLPRQQDLLMQGLQEIISQT